MSTKNTVFQSLLGTAIIVCTITVVSVFCPLKQQCSPEISAPQSGNELFLTLQQKYAHQLEKTLLNLLEPLVGHGKVRTAVQVDLNLKNAQHYIQSHSSEAPLETKTETFEKDIQNFIQKQNISVVVDGNTRQGDRGVYQPRTPQEMQALRRLIQSAVGYNSSRGDTLEIQNIPFAFYTKPLTFSQKLSFMFVSCTVLLVLLLIFFLFHNHTDNPKKLNDNTPFSVDKLDKITQNPARATAVIKNWIYLPSHPRSTDWTFMQKVGIILLALDEDIVRHILVALDDDEVRKIAKTMSTLGVIPPEESARILNEFYDAIFSGSAVVGNAPRVQQILAENLHQKMPVSQTALHSAHQALWQELADVSPQLLATKLDVLAPEISAYILYQLPTDRSAQIVQHLASTKAHQVLIHLSHIGSVCNSTNDKLAQTALTAARQILDTLHTPTGADKMSDILAQLSDTSSGQTMIRDIARKEPSLSKNLTAALIRFDNLDKWNKSTIQTLLKNTPRSVALAALAGAKNSIKQTLQQNVPAQMWPSLAEEIKKNEQTLTADQILAAQQKLVEIARSLLRQGKITL